MKPAPRRGAGKAVPARARLRRAFKYLNQWFMVPAFRWGWGPLLVSPLAGYIMVLETTGRHSGRPRSAPVNYALLDGQVYCAAGWGRETHWLANVQADPRVVLRLPGTVLTGLAAEVTDPTEARRAVVRVVRNAGFAMVFAGLNLGSASDEQLLAAAGTMPVVRIQPTGVYPGPHDPGGGGWVPALFASVLALLLLRGRRKPVRGQR